MAAPALKRLAASFFLILLQVLLLDKISISGCVTPLLYCIVIIKFPTNHSKCAILLWGFLLGLVTDMFLNTYGLHAASATLLAFLQPMLLRLFVNYDKRTTMVPQARSMNRMSYLGYLVMSLLLHHAAYFFLESLSVEVWREFLSRLAFTTLFDAALLFVCELLFLKDPKRRRRR